MTPMIEGAGVELHYAERGSGDAVLLVHETADAGRGWVPVLGRLATRARVIAYDRRGYGKSGAPQVYERTSVNEQGEDAAALLRGLGAVPAVVVGAGFGAPSVLDLLVRAGVPTCGLGKIQDIYCCQGIAAGARTATNAEGIAKTIEWLDRGEGGFCFTNLNDFDSKYGHRRDADGYAKALIALDARLPDILNRLQLGDRLLITADHGCDPTAPGSDHTREFAPLSDYRPREIGVGLGELEAFAQVGSRVMQSFGLAPPAHPLEV